MNFSSTILSFLLVTTIFTGDKDLNFFVKTQSKYKIDNERELSPLVWKLKKIETHNESQVLFIKALKTHSNKNSYNKNVFSRIELSKFIYSNDSTFSYAQNELLKCFPNDCFKINQGENKSIKITPSIIIFGSNTITTALTSCEHVDEKWNSFLIDFVNFYANDSDEIILNECGMLYWHNKQSLLNTKH
jgi:hypothetical protein